LQRPAKQVVLLDARLSARPSTAASGKASGAGAA
jgi:hypothetical protein